jgi:hypothetical protein
MYGLLFSNPINLWEKTIKKNYYCSLCNTLARNYGLPFRSLANHDAVFLSLLTASQMDSDPVTNKVGCNVKGMNPVYPEQQFSSAVALQMVKMKLLDDHYDSSSRLPSLKLALLNKSMKKAETSLNMMEFPTSIFDQEVRRQHFLEKCRSSVSLDDLCSPTENIVSALFMHTSAMSGNFDNTEILSEIGNDVGALMYVLDSYTDVVEDQKRQKFNPLLACEGIWSSSPFRRLGKLRSFSMDFAKRRLERIRQNCSKLDLNHHRRLTISTLTVDLQNQIKSIIEFTNQPRNRYYLMGLAFPMIRFLSFQVGESVQLTPYCPSFDCGECDCSTDDCMDDICQDVVTEVTNTVTDTVVPAVVATAVGVIASGVANSAINTLIGDDIPPEPDEDEGDQDDDNRDLIYSLELSVDKDSINGDGRSQSRIKATVKGSDGGVYNSNATFSFSPLGSSATGTLTQILSEATFQANYRRETTFVIVSCTATVRSWMGSNRSSVKLIETVAIEVLGAIPIMHLKATPDSISSKDKTAIILATIELFEVEVFPESLLFMVAEEHGGLTSQTGKQITFTPKYSPHHKTVTVNATADLVLPDGTPITVTDSTTINIQGGYPRLELTASPGEIVADGSNSVSISAKCNFFGEYVNVKVNFHEHGMGDYYNLLDMSTLFRPIFTLETEEITIWANTTIPVKSDPNGIHVEDSVSITLNGADFKILAEPDPVDGDEISRVRLTLDPPNNTTQSIITLSSDSGKFIGGLQPPTNFIPNLTENDKDVTIVARLETGDEKEKQIKVIGANPQLELRKAQDTVRGDGETRLRIDLDATLFEKRADELRMQNLNAQVEWEEKGTASGQPLGYFEDKHLTYTYFIPNAILEDSETTIVAKLILVSKVTNDRIEKESVPLRIKIAGAYPKLKLVAVPEIVPGEPRKTSEVEARLLLFGEEKAIPEDEEVNFQLLEPQLGSLERLELSVMSFKPVFLARDKNTGKTEHEVKIEGFLDVAISKLFPNFKGNLDEIVHIEAETSIQVLGCIVKITEPASDTSLEARNGKLCDVKAVVTTPNGESVPNIMVAFTFEDETKQPAAISSQNQETNSNGEAIVGLEYSGLDRSNNGPIIITAQINGVKQTRDWDQTTLSITIPEESPLRMELTSIPDRIPGALKTVSIDRIESKVEAKLIGPSGALVIPSGKQVDFKLLDEEFGNLEEPEPSNVTFRPKFLARDKDGGVQERSVSIQGSLEFTEDEVRQLIPSYSGSSEGETVRLEEKTEVTLEGCMVKITEPEGEPSYIAMDGKLFNMKAKVFALASEASERDSIPGVEIKFTFEDTTKVSSEPIVETKITDHEGVVDIDYNFTDAENSKDGEIIVTAEIHGAKKSRDYDKKTFKVAKSPTLTMKTYMSRIRKKEGSEAEETYDPEKYEVSRTIKLEVEEGSHVSEDELE